jgi:hypothetical protein
MTVSPAESQWRAVLLSALVLFSPSAAAQVSGNTGAEAPTRALADSGGGGSTAVRPPSSPATATAPDSQSPQGAPIARAPAIPSDVTVQTLGSIDGAPVGLLGDGNGGLGQDMWIGSSRADLEDELARIPIVSTNPVVRSLARRLLLTRADAPVGPAHRALLTIRLQRLLDGGLIEEAGELAAQAQLSNDAEFARTQAETLLYAGRGPDVCSDRTRIRLTSAESFWLQLRAYCFAAAGDTPSADLTRSILDAQGSNDSGFNQLLEDQETGRAVPPGAILHPTAVDIFLLRKLKLAVTPQVASQLGTAASLLAVNDARNTPIERLSAAEHIVSTGAIATEDLVDLGNLQSFAPEQKAKALQQAGQLPFLTRQVLLRQAAALESRPEAKFAAVRRADPMLNESGPFHVFAALELSNISQFIPQKDDEEKSWIASRILILGGQPEAAASWLGPAENPLIAEAGLALDVLRPTPANDSLALTDLTWLGTHASADSGGWPAATALSTGIWSALGLALPPEAMRSTNSPAPPLFDGIRPEPSEFEKIDRAVSDPTRRGEAVLLILEAIGPRGPARFAPDAAAHLVGDLKKLRLDASARALAAECLLLGPPRPSAPLAPPLAPQSSAALRP